MGQAGPSRWKHPKIKFGSEHSGNEPWDKLLDDQFFVGAEFTTFRIYRAGKDVYYGRRCGDEFAVQLDGKTIGYAELLTVECMWSNKLTLKQVKADTKHNWTKEDFKKVMKKFYGCEVVYGLLLMFKVTKLVEQKKRIPAYVPSPEHDERQKDLSGFFL